MNQYKKRSAKPILVLIFIVFVFTHPIAAQINPIFDSLQLVYSDTIHFESGKWNIDSLAFKALEQFPEPINVKNRIYLTGHTDAIGSMEYNEALAAKRASAAKAVLLKKLWPDFQIFIQTFGERKSIKANDTEANRLMNRRVHVDLYQNVPFLMVKGSITDSETNDGVKAQLRIHSRTHTDSLISLNNGAFQLLLPLDSVYGIDVFAEGYFFKTKMVKVRPSVEPLLKIDLQKATIGASADLSQLYFVGNKAVLLERSEPELPKIKRFLEINNHLRVEIAGHVNYPNNPPVTKDTDEWKLSEKRAKFLYDWLINEGVSADQVSHKGYGNHEMKFPKARSEKEQELNRRVEIRILGERQ